MKPAAKLAPAPATDLARAEIDALAAGAHDDPFARLGMHIDRAGCVRVRAMLPGAVRVGVTVAGGAGERVLKWLAPVHSAGLFDGVVPLRRARFDYRLRIEWPGGITEDRDDPYRFGPLLGELDVWLLAEGRHQRPFEALGAHPRVVDGVAGTAFAVWAPNASRVSVVGDWNGWDGRRHPMRRRREAGLWEIFLPGVGAGAAYKYELLAADGTLLPLHADPFALRAELRPADASIVARLPAPVAAADDARRRANSPDAPISIYEVHPGSWRRTAEGRFLDWDALADQLIEYVRDLGFTHIELMPVSEHPFDGSWGYQPIGLYAPSARFGDPDGLRRFIERAHATGIGVILDWVPAHFPSDVHGLARFDGTALYEHADPREGLHKDWDTLIYNFGRHEVLGYLAGNALYWLERYGADGLRVDAVASMLYRDYSRAPGEWVPNAHGGRENLEAVRFLRRVNELVASERPAAMMCAEESTAWPGVTTPVGEGGLGFRYKWNLGWMHDTLEYMKKDPVHRRHHQNQLTFGLVYAWSERFVLALSHDEVVHGKGSLAGKMPGDDWQKLANLRAYLAFMWTHPGKKLLFMGGEFAQWSEWNHDRALDWHLVDDPQHRGVQALVRDLNRLYRDEPALHRLDASPQGFEWIDHADHAASVLAFVRRDGEGAFVVVVCNFTPVSREGYRIGVPAPGWYRERVNTDSTYYGGSNAGNGAGVASEPVPMHGREHSIALTLPPLATLVLKCAA